MSFAAQWANSVAAVRKILADGGRLIAVAGYYGTNRSTFALMFPPRFYRRYDNDNREKRA